jgi:CRISPR-associated protein Cmr3
MRLFIEPSDVWLFRTSHNFTAGESGFALSIFPPTPETIQGAIRARLAASWNPDLSQAFTNSRLVELIGSRKDYGLFQLTGLTLGRRKGRKVQRLFPPPAHLQRSEKKDATKKYRFYRLTPQMVPDPTVRTSWPDGTADLCLLQLEQPPESPDEKLVDFDHWLTVPGLQAAFGSAAAFRALQDAEPGEWAVEPGDIFEREARLGIGMNSLNKTTAEGLLYQVSFIRLKPDVGLVVDIALDGLEIERVLQKEFPRFPTQGWLALGGERRAASFQILQPDAWDATLQSAAGQRSCLYFVTPTYFTDGWRPSDWNALVKASPIAAAVSRAQLIGGWQQNPDDAGGNPKPLRRCVPAGSVYFFDKTLEVQGPITNRGGQIGYGLTYQGAW